MTRVARVDKHVSRIMQGLALADQDGQTQSAPLLPRQRTGEGSTENGSARVKVQVSLQELRSATSTLQVLHVRPFVISEKENVRSQASARSIKSGGTTVGGTIWAACLRAFLPELTSESTCSNHSRTSRSSPMPCM